MSSTVYLDWNIFNKIEGLPNLKTGEKEIYAQIEKLILHEQLIAPYSNAHMNDLARGYLKNPSYTPGHLTNITRLTKNLCIVQYWAQPRITWHVRDPKVFLDSTIEESDYTAGSFADLLYMDDEPLVNALWELQKQMLRLKPVPTQFREIYTLDPIFKSIFPRTKEDMNLLALCEDLFQFASRIKTDYALYKHFQKFLTQLRLKFPQFQQLYTTTQKKVIGKPANLDFDAMVDKVTLEVKHKSSNAAYDRIFNLFTSYDLKGYNTDERFANLVDDALHCFYSAHCDYFITIDKRCSAKAKKVFEQLKIPTKVVEPEEFVAILQ